MLIRQIIFCSNGLAPDVGMERAVSAIISQLVAELAALVSLTRLR